MYALFVHLYQFSWLKGNDMLGYGLMLIETFCFYETCNFLLKSVRIDFNIHVINHYILSELRNYVKIGAVIHSYEDCY